MNQKQTMDDARELIRDYLEHGLDYIAEICSRGVNKETVKVAARALQNDEAFASWAFVYIMSD